MTNSNMQNTKQKTTDWA